MQSPLAGLCEVLKEVKRLARDHAPKNETHTRIMLIDPVLKALGWDVADPHFVEVERHLVEGIKPRYADYILKAEKPKRPIIIEAKKLHADLNDREQILFYAERVRPESIFVTDGLKWLHYTDFNAGRMNPFELNLNSISDNDLPLKAAAYFVTHLDAALFTKPVEKENEVEKLILKIAELDIQIRELKNPATDVGITGIDIDSRPWQAISDQNFEPTNKTPVLLKILSEEIPVASWKDVLSEICKFCLKKMPELMLHLPIKTGVRGKIYLIGVNKPSGNPTLVELYGKSVYVNTHYSASASVANAIYMLEKLGEGTAAKAAVLLAD